MLKDNQVWENKVRIAKIEKCDKGLQALVFDIKPHGLQLSGVIKSKEQHLKIFLKKANMHPTNKILVVSE